MNQSNKDQINAFVSALQLCIKGEVVVSRHSINNQPPRKLTITFPSEKSIDEGVKFFTKIIEGKWLNEEQYEILNSGPALSQEFINFLLVTRLVKENMLKIAEIDPTYEKYVQKLSFKKTSSGISLNNLAQAKTVIFDYMKENKVTFNELAKKSGLTAMTLNNFRAGADMRLSSFLKITQALGLKVIIQR